MRILILLVTLVFSVTGCNAIKNTTLPDNFVESLPVQHKIKDFPNIRQRDGYSCATTALSMVMSYYDEKSYNKSEVWNASGSNVHRVKNVCGNDMNGLKRAAQHYGFDNYEFIRGLSLDELKYMISQDIPVIVNIRNFNQESYHAVVVIGYDQEGLYFSDSAGYSAFYKKDYKTFLNKWYASLCSPKGSKQRHTAFIVYPKS